MKKYYCFSLMFILAVLAGMGVTFDGVNINVK